ncbi:glycosyltransferase [Aquipseudomonas alcaligenes]|uniref:glycosyltransferase n=1 Tax=Aquipseudomonas alcaligenes TaxID=43263 RepID=UPI00243239AB|nr:glycosyltransferase family 1 protein [Pseudomonas alcaligenes]
MRFLVYSEVNSETISQSLGLSEYSYYFVLKEFLPVLRELGDVCVVKEPREVDSLYAQALREGVPCVFLSFTPPHKTFLRLKCPSVPVLAWEFDTIPNEHWSREPQQDWRYSLRKCGRAITHSEMTLAAIRAEVGSDYPVVSVPAPVWDKYSLLREKLSTAVRRECAEITIRSGVLLDTSIFSLAAHIPIAAAAVAKAREQEELSWKADVLPVAREQSLLRTTYRYGAEWYRLVGRELLSEWLDKARHRILGRALPEVDQPLHNSIPEEWRPSEHRLQLSGVVFTAVFNPYDGRKNWEDMLSAFCEAHRDCPDATLVFKFGSSEYRSAMEDMLVYMARLPKFLCRVVLVHGYLDGADFDALIEGTHFVVNASYGEGQCLPLMEFMSCGRPAVAPLNSAMLDYIDSEVAFVVEGWPDATAWAHDPRRSYRTCRQRINWESLVQAYRDAYHCCKYDPERYSFMSAASIERMRGHCSREVAVLRLREFFKLGEGAGL